MLPTTAMTRGAPLLPAKADKSIPPAQERKIAIIEIPSGEAIGLRSPFRRQVALNGRFPACHGEQSMQYCKRRRGISRNFKVHRENRGNAPCADKAAAEHAARNGATANSQDAPGRRHGFPCLEERAAHVFTHRSDDEQKIRGTWRRREEESQPMEIVKRVVELLDLMKAGAAISGVHHHYMQGLCESRRQRFGACLLFRYAGPFESGFPIHCEVQGPSGTAGSSRIFRGLQSQSGQ